VFLNNPTLLSKSESQVCASVDGSIFTDFVRSIQGDLIEITAANFPGLSSLCSEFGFDEFSSRPSSFQNPHPGSDGSGSAGGRRSHSEWIADLSLFDSSAISATKPTVRVDLYQNPTTGIRIVVKYFAALDSDQKQQFFREIDTLIALDHLYIVPFFGYTL
jgi:hypothetical protein